MKSSFGVSTAVALSLIATSAMAAQPTFTWVKTVDYTPHCCLGNPMAAVTGPDGQGIYFGDWYSDGIFYVSSPLTSDGTENDAAVSTAFDGLGITWSSGSSYQGATRDGNTVYLGGQSDPETMLMSVTEVSPGVWTNTRVTGITGIYSGPSIVSPGVMVMANWATGGLQFFTVAAGVATPLGAEIANTAIADYKVSTVAYDATSGKVFCYLMKDNETRRIDYFNTNGTAAGTTYGGTFAAGVPSTIPVSDLTTLNSRAQLRRSGTLTVNNKYRILIASNRNETDNGFDLFDIGVVDNNETPYKQIRTADLNNTINANAYDVTGSAIFTEGGNDYLALFTKNLLSISQVTDAVVSDWTLY